MRRDLHADAVAGTKVDRSAHGSVLPVERPTAACAPAQSRLFSPVGTSGEVAGSRTGQGMGHSEPRCTP